MAFTRPPVTAADGTFSAAGALAWAAGFGVAGAVSGGIPFFSSATAEGSSALLTAGAVVLGGGTGNPPATDTGLTTTGTGATLVLTATGGIANSSLTSTRIVISGTNGLQTDSAGLTYTAGVLNVTGDVKPSGNLQVLSGSVQAGSWITTAFAQPIGWNTTAGQKYIATNYAAAINAESSGQIDFFTAASGTAGAAITFLTQFSILHTASATRSVTVTGSNGGNPTISVTAGELAVGTNAWTFGIANSVSPTSPDRTLTVTIGATTYYIAAKTTNN